MYNGTDEQSQQIEQPNLGNYYGQEIDAEISNSELKEAVFS